MSEKILICKRCKQQIDYEGLNGMCEDCTSEVLTGEDIDYTEIESYMKQFNVDRKTAIEEIKLVFQEQDNKMQEVYEGIIKSSH